MLGAALGQGLSAPARAMHLLMALILGLGLWLRARGYWYATIPLWVDEAGWALRLIELPLKEHLIRPIGFMAVSKVLARVLGPSEAVLRGLPWFAGTAALLASPALGRRLFQSTPARLLFVACIALSPAAIDLTKEFKPYSVGLSLHLFMIFFALRYAETGGVRDLACALTLACTSVLFAQDTLFAYPGLFLVLGIEAFRARRSRHLLAIGGSAALTLCLLLCLYFFIWRQIEPGEAADYWGTKYDVFYVGADRGIGAHLRWIADKYLGMTQMPGARHERWVSDFVTNSGLLRLRALDDLLWALLGIVGILALAIRRNWRAALLLVTPLVVLTAFNALNRWPYGAFRTNTFVLVYVSAIAASAIDRREERVPWQAFVPVSLLLLAPLFCFEREWHALKHGVAESSAMPAALLELIEMQGPSYGGPPETLLADGWSCPALQYYTKYNPRFKRLHGADMQRRFHSQCFDSYDEYHEMLSVMRVALRDAPEARVWFLLSRKSNYAPFARRWPKQVQRIARSLVGGRYHLLLGVAKTPPE